MDNVCAAEHRADQSTATVPFRLKFGNESGVSGKFQSRAPLILNETVAHPLKGFKKEILQYLLFRVELFIARRTIVDLYHRLIQSYRGKASTTASAEEKSETLASLSFCTSRGDIIFYIHATILAGV